MLLLRMHVPPLTQYLGVRNAHPCVNDKCCKKRFSVDEADTLVKHLRRMLWKDNGTVETRKMALVRLLRHLTVLDPTTGQVARIVYKINNVEVCKSYFKVRLFIT